MIAQKVRQLFGSNRKKSSVSDFFKTLYPESVHYALAHNAAQLGKAEIRALVDRFTYEVVYLVTKGLASAPKQQRQYLEGLTQIYVQCNYRPDDRRDFLVTQIKALPDDTAQAVTISTRAAQSELIPLGMIAILTPIVVGLILKEQALGGFLAGVILVGQLLAVFMANAGGAWDNAKKYIEDGNMGGKGTDNHKASVVGDTVGDPLKDTAGPALNPMIKVMNLVALIMAPIIVQTQAATWPVIVVVGLSLALIVWAVRRSDRQDTDSETLTPSYPVESRQHA